jgi:Xaa-Pro aminopeptidase
VSDPVEVFRHPGRVQGLRELLAREKVEAFVVSHMENVRYLSGFTGSSGLVLVTPGDAFFLTDGRYTIQSAAEVPGFTRMILPQGSSLAEAAGEQVRGTGAKRVAFEEAHLSVKAFESLRKAMPDDVQLIGKSDLVETLRQRKDADEIAAMRRAVALVDACFEHLRTVARPGMSEKELAWEIETFLRGRGAPRLAFESIVASGPNGALPHARPSDRKLGESGEPEFVVFDYGAEVDGYCSDITRTVLVGGEPTPRHREVYEAVLRAQRAALEAIRPGVTGKDVDTVARDLLTQAGLGDRFTHSLGHSLGRVTHDGPAFSQKSELTLAPGMVLTVEPGVYIEGWGGVRIEDDVVVTETGCDILTRSTKELVVLP